MLQSIALIPSGVSKPSMLINSDWREDLRLFRLNNPSYRPLFILLDVLKWGLYLVGVALLVTFCWQVISPRSPVVPAPLSGNTPPGNQSSGSISEDRIEYLRNFASRVRVEETLVAKSDSKEQEKGTKTDAISDRGLIADRGLITDRDVTVQSVVKPDTIEAIVIPANSRDESSLPGTSLPRSGIVSSKTETAEFGAGDEATDIDSGVGSGDGLFGIVDGKAGTEEVLATVESALAETSNLSAGAKNQGGQTDSTQADSTLETLSVAVGSEQEPAAEEQVAYTRNNRAYLSSNWVMAQQGSHYTIQVGATVNRPFLLRFIDTLPEGQDIALFKHRINRANKEEYVLSYGSFASYEQATIALDKLSQSNRRYGAYARSFKSIQNELKKLQTVTAQILSNKSDVSSASSQ